MPNQLIDFLKQHHYIPAADEPVIEAAVEYRCYKKGEYLFKAGKICREMFFVCKGILRIMATDDNGNEVTIFFIPDNKLCSILNSFNNKCVATESIQAVGDVEVIVFTRSKLDNVYGQLPYLKPLINQITHQALLDKIALRTAYLGKDSTTRYKTFIANQPEIAFNVPLSDIASYLEITPQSLSRIRKKIR